MYSSGPEHLLSMYNALGSMPSTVKHVTWVAPRSKLASWLKDCKLQTLAFSHEHHQVDREWPWDSTLGFLSAVKAKHPNQTHLLSAKR